ncbi:MAG: hypothetical protein QOD32_1324 [Pyrinomonadaceae bacterium]|jgi:hypothetical protein|nr:hypothetical protein [Pyrinomonadaceae bacterium]
MNGEVVMKRRLPAVLFVLHVTVLLLLIVLASYSLARAQSATTKLQPDAASKTPATAATAPAEVDRARFDKTRTEGFEALYNLDYEAARARFKELARLYPDHPAGPQFLAASLWLETLNASRRLQSGLYNNESFYAKTEDKVDPKIVAQFKEWTRAAKQLAEARLRKNPKDTEALYFLGATQGLKAAFAGAVERSFVSALRSGSDAVDRHRETIKLDPNYHDAELTIGMQDYIVGGLALPYKILAGVTGTRGSKKRGLATLERVMREGQWARDDARVMLIPLYKREKRYADAAVLARELAAKYPKNYLFKLEYADALVSQAATEREKNSAAAAATTEREAFAIFDSLLRDRAARDAAARQLDLIHFQYGEALFVAGQFERAAKEFLAAASVPQAEANQATLARLRAAQTLDLAGKREDALAQYKLVAARPNVYDSLEEARRGLREPYRKPAPKPAEDN